MNLNRSWIIWTNGRIKWWHFNIKYDDLVYYIRYFHLIFMKSEVFMSSNSEKCESTSWNHSPYYCIYWHCFSPSDILSGIWNVFNHCHFFLSFSSDSEEQSWFNAASDPVPRKRHWAFPEDTGWTWQVCRKDEHILFCMFDHLIKHLQHWKISFEPFFPMISF